MKNDTLEETEMSNKKIPGLGFHHIALKVVDFEKAYRFYTETLGLEEYASWLSGETKIALLDMGDGRYLELFSGGTAEEEANQRYIHFAFAAPDVQSAYDLAVDGGAVPLKAPFEKEVDSVPEKLTLNCAFVRGMGGEEIEFFRTL